MNCIVVDDNKLARAALTQLIKQFDFLELKQECENAIDAINFLNKTPIDLLLLDVEMPGMTGIELVRNLQQRPLIILITSKKNYAVEAFELNVVDYIVKPVTLPRFIAAVNRAKELFEGRTEKIEVSGKEMDYIFVRNNSVITKILINDIYYVQALGDYVNIFTRDKRFTIHMTLSGIEQKLPADKFYRLHRSYVVALNHIDNIEEGTAFVNKQPIPIGEQYKQVLLKKINFI